MHKCPAGKCPAGKCPAGSSSLLHLHAGLRNIHHRGDRGGELLASVNEAAALAAVAARDDGQGDDDEDAYGDSCDATFIEDAAVIRGTAGAADVDRVIGGSAPLLVVFPGEPAAFSLVHI